MLIIGCDFHSGFQQIAIFDNQAEEFYEKKLLHPAEAREFYRGLSGPVRVGMEAGVPCQWFRRLLGECGHELWVGDAAKIRAAEPRKQKTDRRDAELILKLMREGRFPRIWLPSEEERDVRQLLMDRHHRMRTRTQVKNQLQALALNQGLQKGKKLWSEAGRQQLRELPMMEHAARRRNRAVAKVMVARRLAVRLYWMLRNQWTYAELARHAGEPGSSCGAR
jgi:transposase